VPNMDVWSVGLVAIGGFVAVATLVRLMRIRRDSLVAELGAEAREEQHRKQLAEMLEKKKQKKRSG
jgi:hypothetical protein